jgi:hypothetical protein
MTLRGVPVLQYDGPAAGCPPTSTRGSRATGFRRSRWLVSSCRSASTQAYSPAVARALVRRLQQRMALALRAVDLDGELAPGGA